MITVTMLGTSALVPLPERAETAVLLNCDGHTLLFDCGEGTQCAARKAGVSLMKTEYIALTHYHGDHIFGLPGLLQTMTMMGRTEPLTVFGPGNIEKELAPIMKLTDWIGFPVLLRRLPPEGLHLAGLPQAVLTAFSTQHRVESQGYCFVLNRAGKFMPQKAKELGIPQKMWGLLQRGQTVEFEGKIFAPEDVLGESRKGLKFVFSGDTCACEGLIAAAADADLLICEGTYGENGQAELAAEYGHMNFAQAAEVAAAANAKELWLTHFSQRIKDPQEYLPNATAFFANTVCCTDGMSKTLQFEK